MSNVLDEVKEMTSPSEYSSASVSMSSSKSGPFVGLETKKNTEIIMPYTRKS